jgi:hypothetical protein
MSDSGVVLVYCDRILTRANVNRKIPLLARKRRIILIECNRRGSWLDFDGEVPQDETARRHAKAHQKITAGRHILKNSLAGEISRSRLLDVRFQCLGRRCVELRVISQ